MRYWILAVALTALLGTVAVAGLDDDCDWTWELEEAEFEWWSQSVPFNPATNCWHWPNGSYVGQGPGPLKVVRHNGVTGETQVGDLPAGTPVPVPYGTHLVTWGDGRQTDMVFGSRYAEERDADFWTHYDRY